MANTTNFGWETPDDTDLVKDGAAAIRTLGSAIDTSLVDLKGGTTGQVLSKTSNTDMDFTWVTTDDTNAIQNAIVDAKGDLISATAADTPARLASSGVNGDVLTVDTSTSTGLKWSAPAPAIGANCIINSNFDFWQRGTSFTTVANQAYTADRFQIVHSGTSVNVTASQQTDVPNVRSEYSIEVKQVTSNATSVNEYAINHIVEQFNALPYLGNSCTLSFWYKSNKTGSHGVRIYGSNNTGGTDQQTTFTVSAADTWEYKTVAVTALSAVSASSATINNSAFNINIGFRVSNNGFSSISANDYFRVSQIKFEVGSSATTYSRFGSTITEELAACQRYFWRQTASNAYSAFAAHGIMFSTTYGYLQNALPVTMRATPTFAQSNVALNDGASDVAIATTGTNRSTTKTGAIELEGTGANWSAVSRPVTMRANNNSAAYIEWSAEL